MQENTFMMPETPQEGTGVTEVKEEIRAARSGFFTFNCNTLLLLILFAGLVVLYVLFFTSGRSAATVPAAAIPAGGKPSIVFVNIDSLNANYDFVKVLKSDLESTGKRYQEEILSEQASLEKEAANFQRQVAANAISEEKAKQIYEDLMMKQQALMDKKDQRTQQVAEQEYNLNVRLLDTVTNFLKRYNAKTGYDYILGYKTAGEILLANDTLDITKLVIDELNQEYKAAKK
jgi:outer membrane protein